MGWEGRAQLQHWGILWLEAARAELGAPFVLWLSTRLLSVPGVLSAWIPSLPTPRVPPHSRGTATPAYSRLNAPPYHLAG